MTGDNNIRKGLTSVAWGYFFLYFNLSLFGLNVLPSFVGYLLFLSAIAQLKNEERELSLLYTLGVLMILRTGAEWLASLIGISLDGRWQFIDILTALVNVYFHFQLLTNLASVAVKHQEAGKTFDKQILLYRTLQTLMLTVVNIALLISPMFFELRPIITLCIGVVYVFAGICLMTVLLRLRKCLRPNNAEY